MFTGYYTDEQVKRLLNEIYDKLPVNEPKFVGIRKFVKDKIDNIEKHI